MKTVAGQVETIQVSHEIRWESTEKALSFFRMRRIFVAAWVVSVIFMLFAGRSEANDEGDGSSVPGCAMNIEQYLSELAVPGLSAVIVKNDCVACTAVAGMANIEERRLVEPDTIFAWASVSIPNAVEPCLFSLARQGPDQFSLRSKA